MPEDTTTRHTPPAEDAATVLDTVPPPFRVVETAWIPMPDGARLAATLWLPLDAEETPVPAILEYLPYRRRDVKAVRDHTTHAYFAAHGYAGVRVDMRGTGDSDGVLEDEYSEQELADGQAILAWLAAQPWCTGRVGLYGISWGGFNGLQLAALNPPELGAVVTVASSDDRYADDIHYMGGCLLLEHLSWSATMLAFNACPPDPAVVGAGWRAMWHQRLEANRPWLTQWLAHQRRDAFWERASVCEDYAAIRAPVFAVGGWRDGYPNTVFRLVEHLSCPVRGLVGSWAHRFPHLDGPGPAIDFLGECLAWWDRWLKGIENGAENAPAMCAWMLDPSSPLDDSAPGRWVSDTAWPPAGLAPSPYALGPGRLVPGDAPAAGEDDVLTIPAPLAAAFHAGRWCAYEEDVDLAGDQRMDDGAALVFETAPLAEDVEVLGAPVVTLALACDRGQAMVAARLSAVAPDGTVERISYGVLNLSQRESRAEPQPLTPGRRETVTVTLKVAGRRIAAGERLRLALTAGYWPLVWPAPEPAALSLWPAASRLTLPVRPRRAGDGATFGPVRRWAAPAHTVLAPAERQTRVTIDTLTREVALEIVNDAPVIRHDGHGMVFANPCRERYAHRAEDPDSLVAEVRNDRHFRRDIEGAERLDIRIETRSRLTASPTHWCLATTVEAYEGETRVFSRTWDDRIERDHM